MSDVKTYLDDIVARHRRAASVDDRRLDDVLVDVGQLLPARGFTDELATADGLGVIAEIKRRSPSKGDLLVDLDPSEIAGSYADGGATCLSVLTDGESFGGSPEDLAAARAAVSMPILRKDFTVSELDVADARVMGADCVLLIAAVLDDRELARFHALAIDIGMDVLVEVHDEPELERALDAGATLVGVNQRDLVTFEVDHERALRMAAAFPDDVVSVAESGVRGAADAADLAGAGYDAVLVGESLVTSGDPAAAVAALRSAAGFRD